MITSEERLSAYNKASPTIMEMYGSLETGKMLRSVRKKYSITRDEFIDVVGDIMLNLRSRGELLQILVSEIGMAPDIARAVSQELKPFFDRVEGGVVPGADSSLKERLELRPQTGTGTTTSQMKPTPQGEGAKPLTREELLSALSAKRTMASDIEAVKRAQTSPPQSPKPSIPPPPPPSQTG